MKRSRLLASCLVLGLVAPMNAGPFDLLKNAASSVPGGSKAGAYIDATAKLADAAGVNTPEGRQSIGQAVTIAATAKYNGLDDRDSVQAYVTLVGLTVARAADPSESNGKYVFGVLNSDDATACSGPGGYVMITRGALAMMSDESELAGVLAHEIAHVYKNHGIAAVKSSKLVDAGATVANAADSHVAAFNSFTDNFVTNVLEKGYSRGQEGEADKLAVQFVAKAGYDPQGYVRFLKKLEAAKTSNPSLFATHPSTKDRVKSVDKLAKAGGATLGERFAKYLHPAG